MLRWENRKKKKINSSGIFDWDDKGAFEPLSSRKILLKFFKKYINQVLILHLRDYEYEDFQKRVEDFCTVFQWRGGWYKSDFLPELKKAEHQILKDLEKVEDQSLYYPEKQKETLPKKASRQEKNRKNHENILNILRDFQSLKLSKEEDSDRKNTSVSAVSTPQKSLVSEILASSNPA